MPYQTPHGQAEHHGIGRFSDLAPYLHPAAAAEPGITLAAFTSSHSGKN
jgi:hypothetical protein